MPDPTSLSYMGEAERFGTDAAAEAGPHHRLS
jgi:hypothetical protein